MNPTQRFSNRVEDYRKYRPGYPAQIIADLTAAGMLSSTSVVADIGSGTGLSTRLFLEHGNRVFGVEPNADMRAAGEEDLRAYPRFTSVDGTAENTTLAERSVDLICAGQAFHWFDRAAARREFQRILRPGGWCVLMWNDRQTDTTRFLIEYERLLQEYSTDYSAVDHKQITAEVIAAFFAPQPVTHRAYMRNQRFDFAGLRGRLLSSSYAPPAGHPKYEPMLAALARLFDARQRDGLVTVEYQTIVYAAQLAP